MFGLGLQQDERKSQKLRRRHRRNSEPSFALYRKIDQSPESEVNHMVQQTAEVSQQDWKDALNEFGGTIYAEEIQVAFFAQRGVQVMERPMFRLLITDALLFEILDWKGETDAEGKVRRLHEFLENRGLIDSDGKVVRWKEKLTVVDSANSNVSA